MAPQGDGTVRIRTAAHLSDLRDTHFYTGIRKRKGPQREHLAHKPRVTPTKHPTTPPRKSYTIKYKLRILSWLQVNSVSSGPSPGDLRKPTIKETANRFCLPIANVSRWKAEEKAGKYLNVLGMARRVEGGGRKRKWREMERKLYELFRQRRAAGRVIRRSWFRQNAVRIFEETYEEQGRGDFRFSNGWFRGFLSWHQITLRAITNQASQLPSDYETTIIDWLNSNRRNSEVRGEDRYGLGDTSEAIGRYRLRNICNMDQTPLPFEYLSGRTYNQRGEKTIWAQRSTQSGWDKRQATIRLTVFADAVPRVKPLVFFRGQGVGPTILAERQLYDNRVVVKFNSKAYANSANIVEWLDQQLIPVLNNEPTLLALDMFSGHQTEEVLDTLTAHDITVSNIPGGCTSLLQPLDVSINKPFKDILKEVLEEKVDLMEVEEDRILAGGGKLSGSIVGRRRVLCTWAIGEAWERFCHNHAGVVKRAFEAVGLSLPIDGSRDSEISIKGLPNSVLYNGLRSGNNESSLGEEDDMDELDSGEDNLDGEYFVGEVD